MIFTLSVDTSVTTGPLSITFIDISTFLGLLVNFVAFVTSATERSLIEVHGSDLIHTIPMGILFTLIAHVILHLYALLI